MMSPTLERHGVVLEIPKHGTQSLQPPASEDQLVVIQWKDVEVNGEVLVADGHRYVFADAVRWYVVAATVRLLASCI